MLVLVVALLLIVGMKILTHKNKTRQLTMESRLPSIQKQEEDTEKNVLAKPVRVLLKTDGFLQTTHATVSLRAKSGLLLTAGDRKKETEGGKTVTVKPDDGLFALGSITVTPKKAGEKITVSSLKRGYGKPSYRGKLQLYSTAEGIVIINELDVEEYLYGVVPSEMPSSYEKAALQAQAICARSYAYIKMKTYAYKKYKAHLDDSTSFQVYGNSPEASSSTEAVKSTKGKLLYYGDKVVSTYFYSTSCGNSTSIEAWGAKLTKGNSYLKGVDICDENGEDYERDLPWYRWTATIQSQTLSNLIELNTGTEIGSLTDLRITKTGAGGIALELKATGTLDSVTVKTENKIRKALGGSGYTIKKQDGSEVQSTALLPSAFITITKKDGCYTIQGGGFGHGIGMSQNGANAMAKAGKSEKEILELFYPGTKVK